MTKLLLCLTLSMFALCVDALPPTWGDCTIFGDEDEWNRDISNDEVDPMSDCYIANQFSGNSIHLDMGITEEYWGIPYVVVNSSTPLAVISYYAGSLNYSDESDPGPFPIPLQAPIEGGDDSDPNPSSGDRHVIAIDVDSCWLYELYDTVRTENGFQCASSAKFDLSATDYHRPSGWTSADAAGLPIFPGLLKWEEASSGNITHALRFTVPTAQRAYTYPGNHLGTSTDINTPPYGQRFRLKASFDESPFTGVALTIVQAWKRYGLIFADQGSAVFVTGTTNANWADTFDQLNDVIDGSNLEAVMPKYNVTRGFTPDGPITCSPGTSSTSQSTTSASTSYNVQYSLVCISLLVLSLSL